MTDNAGIVREMVDRFLGWKLPADFSPDCGIHYAPLPHPNSWPIGTNLLSATQAQAMLEHVAGPAIAELAGAMDSINEILIKHQDTLHDVRAELATAKADLVRVREDEREREERIIALMIFLRWWDEDPEDMSDDRIAKLVAHFETGFLPSLNEPHCGDCTKVAAPCTRCHTEELLATAKRLRAALAPEQKGE